MDTAREYDVDKRIHFGLKTTRGLVQRGIRKPIGDGTDMCHFTPDHNPWDERSRVVPNGGLFKTLRSGAASVVTDHIERFTETGVLTFDAHAE